MASEGVVLLHGIGRTSRSMVKMARSLEAAGFDTLNLDYESRHHPIDRLTDDVRDAIASFAVANRRVHIVTHSMGGLVARASLAKGRRPWLGRVVMLGPPHHGSRLADLLHDRRSYRALFGPAGQQLTTTHAALLSAHWGMIDYPLGIVAGRRWPPSPLQRGPSDGKVSVESTKLAGMADHVVVRAAHPWLMSNDDAIRQTIAFLRHGRFGGSLRTGTPAV